MQAICAICGSLNVRKGLTFCSKQCANSRTRHAERTRICLCCAQEFLLKGAGKSRASLKYCSRDCAAKHTGLAKRGKTLETFWSRVQHCEHEWLCFYCCWPWTGSQGSRYGHLDVGTAHIGAHRLAWELGNGQPFPEGFHAAHYCHFPFCCNFMHIHPATPKENIADSVRDHRILFGEHHGNSKLSEEAAIEALRLRTEAWSIKDIAIYLQVSKSTVQILCAGETWQHLPRPDGMIRQKPGPKPKTKRQQEQLVQIVGN